jgi:nucleotide-binding universal stress UspA family protein
MNTIVAAIDATAAARPVLETALRLGRTISADVEAVYVADGPVLTPESVAERMSVKVRRLEVLPVMLSSKPSRRRLSPWLSSVSEPRQAADVRLEELLFTCSSGPPS